MNAYKRSLCSTCIHVNSCSLISNNAFIWSCSEFDQEETSEGNIVTLTAKDFDEISSKKELELI